MNLNSIERYTVKNKSSSHSFLYPISTPLTKINSVEFLLKVFHAYASDVIAFVLHREQQFCNLIFLLKRGRVGDHYVKGILEPT